MLSYDQFAVLKLGLKRKKNLITTQPFLDKASCLSVEALNPPSGCTLLDSCAAPGMKTCQGL